MMTGGLGITWWLEITWWLGITMMTGGLGITWWLGITMMTGGLGITYSNPDTTIDNFMMAFTWILYCKNLIINNYSSLL